MSRKGNRVAIREPRLGIDIGRVIIDGGAHPDGGDTAFFSGDEATMLATPEVPDAVATIARLVPLFGGRVWLVSKCGEQVQARTLRWLDAHDFAARTGMDPTHVRFCRQRPQKRDHAVRLGLTHFVDDRADVHTALDGVVPFRYFFGPGPGPVPAGCLHTPTWTDAGRLIEASLAVPVTSPPEVGSVR